MVTSIRQTVRGIVFQNRHLARFYYFLSFSRPVLPQWVGADYYREKSSWGLQPERCPCDIELVEYLQNHNIQDQTIFHFGTGSHHILGLENQKFSQPNEIIGITASAPEHQEYVRLSLKDRLLSKYYKVLCTDIFTLTDRSLPMLDVISLFHIGEFYMPEEAPFLHHDEESLVEMFLNKLNPGGKILFYTKSIGWGHAKPIIESFVKQGKMHKIEEYKNLLVYTKCRLN